MLLIVVVSVQIYSAHTESEKACVIGYDGPTSRIVLDFLRRQPNLDVAFFDLNVGNLKKEMAELLQLLQVSGITILPKNLCLPCVMHGRTMAEVLVEYSSPAIGLFRSGSLTSVSFGIVDTRLLSEALQASSNNVVVFTLYGRFEVTDVGLGEKIEKLFLEGKGIFNIGADPVGLIIPITGLALTDSVNPCTFMVFTAMLLFVLQSFGRARAVASGLCFIYAIFAGYYIIGLIGITFFKVLEGIDKALALLGLIFGCLTTINGLTGRSPIPHQLRVFLNEMVRRTDGSLIASFALGLFSAFTLLPCSSGPYIVGLGLLSALKATGQAYILLALYNLIFVLPLILILTFFAFSGKMVRKVKVFRSEVFRRKGVIDILGGAALIIVCTYILL
ncbi:MAG: hypothetical protein QXI32_04135 [Candidatus Bathyarchaeia archaeon]